MRRTLLILLVFPAALLALPAGVSSAESTATADVVFDGAVTESTTESPPGDPADELLGDESGRPSVLVILAGLAAAGGVVALAIGHARQRNQLDEDDGPT